MNASANGLAAMLEAIRVLAAQETGYQPYRTFLFVAYSGEGLDGGTPVDPADINKFLQAKAGFATAFSLEAVVPLQSLGAGQKDSLALTAGGNQRLASLFERSARRMGVPTSRVEEAVDISAVFQDRSHRVAGGQEAPTIRLSWEGWEGTARTAQDTVAAIDPGRLEQAGKALALALMIMGRENRY